MPSSSGVASESCSMSILSGPLSVLLCSTEHPRRIQSNAHARNDPLGWEIAAFSVPASDESQHATMRLRSPMEYVS